MFSISSQCISAISSRASSMLCLQSPRTYCNLQFQTKGKHDITIEKLLQLHKSIIAWNVKNIFSILTRWRWFSLSINICFNRFHSRSKFLITITSLKSQFSSEYIFLFTRISSLQFSGINLIWYLRPFSIKIFFPYVAMKILSFLY